MAAEDEEEDDHDNTDEQHDKRQPTGGGVGLRGTTNQIVCTRYTSVVLTTSRSTERQRNEELIEEWERGSKRVMFYLVLEFLKIRRRRSPA